MKKRMVLVSFRIIIHYAGDFGDRQKVFKLDKDGMSKQTAQTYGNTLIEMINDNQNADLH